MASADSTASNDNKQDESTKEEALQAAADQARMEESAQNQPATDDPADDQAAELERLQAEAAKYKDQWIRTAAEMENNRKRAQRELEDSARYAITGFARDIVDMVENLIRATNSIPAEARQDNELLKTLGEGVDLTLQETMKVLEKNKITRIDPMDQKFNHDFHQAVAQVERTDVEPGTVVQVIQAGYVLHDRLLRPAMVAVSKAPDTPPQKVDTKV